MICLDTAARTVGHLAVNRKHNARTVQPFCNLRRRDADHAAMPPFTGNHRDVTVFWIFQLGNSEIDDLLLHCLALFVARVEMIREPARFVRVASIKELDYRASGVHATGGVYTWTKSKTQIVCCHALAVSATGNVDQRTQTRVSDLRQILQTNRHDGAILTDEFRDVGNRADCHNLHKGRYLSLASILSKKRMDELESDADAGQVLIFCCFSFLISLFLFV